MSLIARRAAAPFAAVLILIFAGAAGVSAKPYLTGDDVPILKLIAPPPAQDSQITAREMAEVLALQASRTEAQAAHAVADANEENVTRFLAGMDIAIDAAKIPLTVALVERLGETESAVTDGAKRGFNRPRPPFVNPAVKPLGRISKSGSYPSGHSTFGTLTGIVLANMAPEKREAIFARVRDYANSRLVVGAHYRSDIEAGVLSGTAIAAVLMNNEAFKTDFAAAKTELRAALGL